ncbi:MAG: DegV family protein [Lachnospirales bacterium]
MIQIITDSASDITTKEAEEMGIQIVPLRIQFEDGECPQETEQDFLTFYKRLEQADQLPKTSQPSPQAYLEYFEAAKEAGDDVLVITLSSGLSGTIGAARTAKDISEYDRVFLVDSRLAILAQRMLVEYAVKLRAQQMPVEEIVKKLEEIRDQITVCGMLDTLTYLKKGGRIPAALAVIGNVIGIKPVIILEDKILKSIAKVRGRSAGKKKLHEKLEERGANPDFPVYFGFTSSREIGEEFMKETVEKYHLKNARLYPVGGVIGTHVGTNCMAICFVNQKEREVLCED